MTVKRIMCCCIFQFTLVSETEGSLRGLIVLLDHGVDCHSFPVIRLCGKMSGRCVSELV